ncbi:hypothetical protein [Bartonella machadoae]|uniref:hypothetical protein n=1 Tax=Bartonella machadoae TaxID=2893471 RepID=UPI001F4D253E|nr:hypothetical protein [Bartonella machadoae]UNE53622.1 hypothetical protein LNM86_08185 [Bartonella machadoae]
MTMRLNASEILLAAAFLMFIVLLFSGVMFRFALHYRDQVKALKEQLITLKNSMKAVDKQYTWAMSKALKNVAKTVSDRNIAVKERDETITALRQDLEWYGEMLKARDEEIEKLKQDLKMRSEVVKTPSHKKKRK